MKEMNIDSLIRSNIKALKAYSSARNDYKGKEGVFLDANENALGSPANLQVSRYPDPLQLDLKEKIGQIKGLPIQNIFIGNGSDEAIDILLRVFCVPGKDNVIINTPTYGMYEVLANINDVEVKEVSLLVGGFDLNIDEIFASLNKNTKLIFICSPNNPTGNVFDPSVIELLLKEFEGIVVVDEAYINFSVAKSVIQLLLKYPNLAVLQTFSKAWGLAGLRVGVAFASEAIIDLMNRIKSPYNIGSLAQDIALKALDSLSEVNKSIVELVKLRKELFYELSSLDCVIRVYPSEANFLLVKFKDADAVYKYLLQNQIIVRSRSNQPLCENCLRITVGTLEENNKLINYLKEYKRK